MSNKKKGIIPPVQLALFSGIAGHLINSILGNVEHNAAVEQSRNVTVDPNGTVVQKKRGSKGADMVDIDNVAEEFVEENCPYISPVGNPSLRYYVTQSVNIGRYPHNDIMIPDETVSRVHCRIYVRNGKYYLIDMGASSPAKLNGRSVDNSKPRSIDELYDFELNDGDSIVIGRTEYVFRRTAEKDSNYRQTMSSCNSTVVLD